MIAEGQIPPLGNPFLEDQPDAPELGNKSSLQTVMNEMEVIAK